MKKERVELQAPIEEENEEEKPISNSNSAEIEDSQEEDEDSFLEVFIPRDIYIKPHFIVYSTEELQRVTKNVTMKKPSGPYVFFSLERYAEDKKKNPNICNFSGMSQIYGEEWQKLSEEEKKPYIKKFEEDRKRYEQDYLIVKSVLVQDYDDEGCSAFRLYANDKLRKEVMKGGIVYEKEVNIQAEQEWNQMKDEQKQYWELKKEDNEQFWINAKTSNYGYVSYSLFCKKQFEAAKKEGKEMDYETCLENWENLPEEEINKLDEEINAIRMERKRAKELISAKKGEKPKVIRSAFEVYASEKAIEGKDKLNIIERQAEWDKLSNSEKMIYEEKKRQMVLSFLYRKSLYAKSKKANKPKRAKTAYNIFSETFKGKKIPVGHKNTGTWIAEKWKNLPPNKKEYYEKLAEEEKAKVEKENKINQTENRIYDKPKKYFTSFMFFILERKTEDERMEVAVKRLKDDWKKLTQEQKSKYERLSLKDKEDYDKKMEMFNEKGYYIDKDICEENKEKKMDKSNRCKIFFEHSLRILPRKKVASKSKGKNKK